MDIDLSKVIGYSKDCLKSRTLMRAIMKDLYPDKTREMNVLLDIYESGVPKEIRHNGAISSEQYQQYVEQIINNYGLQERFVCEGLDCWIDYCISPGTAAKVSRKKELSNGNTAGHQTREEIKHKPVDNTPINGDASDYEVTFLSSGKLEIKKFIGFDETTIVVPNVIDGKLVIGIGEDAYKSCVSVECVIISEGIEYISDGAFSECEKLKSIRIPSSVSRIGSKGGNSSSTNGAFSKTSIETIDLPKGISYLGKGTFCECKQLKAINLPNSIVRIEDNCFMGCTSLKNVQFPDKINIIGASAFSHCDNLNNIILPANTRIIEQGAFSYCKMLTNILLNEGLISIRYYAFQNCEALTKIIIPSTVTELGEEVFSSLTLHLPRDRRRHGWYTNDKNENLVIYCYSGSKGLEYARKEGYKIENAAKLNS